MSKAVGTQFQGFGGSLLLGAHARSRRPVSAQHALHVVVRSQLAKGELSMRHQHHKRRVDLIVRTQAARWRVRIYEYANVGNHLHVLVRIRSRGAYTGFIRAITGLIARAVLGAERGASKGTRFWQARPFTRLVQWGHSFVVAKNYVIKNAHETLGFYNHERWFSTEARGAP